MQTLQDRVEMYFKACTFRNKAILARPLSLGIGFLGDWQCTYVTFGTRNDLKESIFFEYYTHTKSRSVVPAGS